VCSIYNSQFILPKMVSNMVIFCCIFSFISRYFAVYMQEEMFKGDKKAKKQYRDASGAGMLSNETMVSFQHAHLSVSLECDYFFFSIGLTSLFPCMRT
jgi:hypothetical protein